MANYILKELPEEMTDGKKVVFPKMQNCTLLDHKKVVHNMHMFTGPINDGLIYTVLGALVETMAWGVLRILGIRYFHAFRKRNCAE